MIIRTRLIPGKVDRCLKICGSPRAGLVLRMHRTVDGHHWRPLCDV